MIRQLGENLHINDGHTSCENVSMRVHPFTVVNLNNNDRGVAQWSLCSSGFGILSALKMLTTFKFITCQEKEKPRELHSLITFLFDGGVHQPESK